MKSFVSDSFSAFLVKNAVFTDNEKYPIINEKFISKEVPKKLIPFNKALSCKDLSEYFICFYAPDKTFERVRRNPKRYIPLFKRAAGIIGFDYSVHSDMPIILQKSQIYDNLALTYYYGENGVNIICNIREGVDEVNDEYFKALPRNSLVSIGTHGFVNTISKETNIYFLLKRIIDELNPTGIVVYGPLPQRIRDIFPNTKFYQYDSWIVTDKKRRQNNVK